MNLIEADPLKNLKLITHPLLFAVLLRIFRIMLEYINHFNEFFHETFPKVCEVLAAPKKVES